jgi:hypothetical protein
MIEDLLRDSLNDHESVVPDHLVDDAIRDGYRMRQRRRRLAAIPIVALLGAIVTVTVAVRSGSDTAPSDGHPTHLSVTTPTVTAKSTVTTSPTSPTTVLPVGLSSRLWPVGDVVASIGDGRAVDAIVRPDASSRTSNVIRFDPVSGRTLARSEQFDGGFSLVRAGPWLWASDWPIAPGGGHVGELVQLDPTTLAVHRRIGVADQWAPDLAGNGNVLWAATTTHLYRVDPARGTIVRTVLLEGNDTGALAQVALDPNGRWLWVAQTNVGLDPQNPNKSYSPLLLTRRDPFGGAVQTQRRDLPSVAGGTVLPVTDGVWVAASGGHFVFVSRLDADTLATDATWANAADSVGPNGATVSVTGNRIWVLNPIPSTTIACADARTGAVLATRQVAQVQDGSAIAVVDSKLVISTRAGFAVADLPVPCRST